MDDVGIATQLQRLPRCGKLEVFMSLRDLELTARFADPGEHVSHTGRSLRSHRQSFQSIAGSIPQLRPLASVRVVRNRNNVGIVRSFRADEQPALMAQPSQRLKQISRRRFSSAAPVGRVDYQYIHLRVVQLRPHQEQLSSGEAAGDHRSLSRSRCVQSHWDADPAKLPTAPRRRHCQAKEAGRDNPVRMQPPRPRASY